MKTRHKDRLAYLSQILSGLAENQINDDIPLSEAALPAAMHCIAVLQDGLPQGDPPTLVKLTEEEYARQFPDYWTILMREFDPTYVDPRTDPPAAPKVRRRSRLL